MHLSIRSRPGGASWWITTLRWRHGKMWAPWGQTNKDDPWCNQSRLRHLKTRGGILSRFADTPISPCALVLVAQGQPTTQTSPWRRQAFSFSRDRMLQLPGNHGPKPDSVFSMLKVQELPASQKKVTSRSSPISAHHRLCDFSSCPPLCARSSPTSFVFSVSRSPPRSRNNNTNSHTHTRFKVSLKSYLTYAYIPT